MKSVALLIALAFMVLVPASAAGFALPGTLVATSEWLEDCADCTYYAGGTELSVRTDHGRFRHLAKLERRLGEGFEFGRRQRVYARPSLSPDGTAIAVVNMRAQIVLRGVDLDRMTVVGPRRVVAHLRHKDRLTNVAWSSDARSVIFGGRLHGQRSVWVVARDGRGSHRVLCGCDGTLPRHTEVKGVTWAPLQRIAVLTADDNVDDDNEHAAAYIISATGGDAVRIATSALAGSVFSGYYFSGPWWAPDGRLVVARNVPFDVSWNVALVAIDPATGSFSYLKKGVLSPAWSPDGNLMAYIPAGTVHIRITGAAGIRRISTRGIPGGGWIDQLAWLRRPAPR